MTKSLFDSFEFNNDGSKSLRAQATPDFLSSDAFKGEVERHLDWYNRQPTPFVSTFSSRQHAENWAYQRVEKGDRYVAILELNPQRLGPIFSVQQLVQDPGVYTDLPENMYEDDP